MRETYINFINQNDPTDIFTVAADNDEKAFHFLTMYVALGYDFEIYTP